MQVVRGRGLAPQHQNQCGPLRSVPGIGVKKAAKPRLRLVGHGRLEALMYDAPKNAADADPFPIGVNDG
jgi:hypothetical protein